MGEVLELSNRPGAAGQELSYPCIAYSVVKERLICLVAYVRGLLHPAPMF